MTMGFVSREIKNICLKIHKENDSNFFLEGGSIINDSYLQSLGRELGAGGT